MADKQLILGSGISALAYMFYNPEAHALAGEQVGGLFAQRAMGPQYVWVTDSTRKFMDDLGLDVKLKKIKVGYIVSDDLIHAKDFVNFDDVRTAYSMKTRGIKPEKSHMSSGQAEFTVFDITVGDLVRILMERVGMRLIRKSADMIDLYNHTVHSKFDKFQYDLLVSTVPAPAFLRLIGQGELVSKLKAYDKVYQETPAEYQFEHEMVEMGFDYLYVPNPRYPFHRVSSKGGGIIREYTITGPGVNVPEGCKVQPAGQIVSGHEVLESVPEGIIFLGRYAEWKHNRRLENTLEAIQ